MNWLYLIPIIVFLFFIGVGLYTNYSKKFN
jgi:nitrogen fixation-related uncharacterized protein